MAVYHNDNCITTSNSHTLHTFTHDMEIGNTIPKRTPFFTTSIHIMFHKRFLMIQSLDISLISICLLAILLAVVGQYYSIPMMDCTRQTWLQIEELSHHQHKRLYLERLLVKEVQSVGKGCILKHGHKLPHSL